MDMGRDPFSGTEFVPVDNPHDYVAVFHSIAATSKRYSLTILFNSKYFYPLVPKC